MNRNGMPTTYRQLDAYLGDEVERGLCNNTRARRDNTDGIETIEITLHGHTIASLGQYSVYVRDAGWQTPTTKDRINRFLPRGYYVFQQDYVWYIHTPLGNEEWNCCYHVEM